MNKKKRVAKNSRPPFYAIHKPEKQSVIHYNGVFQVVKWKNKKYFCKKSY